MSSLQHSTRTVHRVHFPYTLPLINPASLLWLLFVVVAALLAGGVIFFLAILKGKEIEARLQRRSQKLSRSILGGVFSEQVAPFLPDFPKDLKASEARFIGKPVDFLIFKGMDEQQVSEVVFVEIKSGKSQLSNNERSLRDAIQEKRVRWRVPRRPRHRRLTRPETTPEHSFPDVRRHRPDVHSLPQTGDD